MRAVGERGLGGGMHVAWFVVDWMDVLGLGSSIAWVRNCMETEGAEKALRQRNWKNQNEAVSMVLENSYLHRK